MKIDRVHFYVEDAKAWRDWFVRVMGFQAIASGNNSHTQTEVIRSSAGNFDKINPIVFVLSSPLTNRSPVAEFLNLHPPGIADVAFLVDDLPNVMARAVSWGAEIREPLQQSQSSAGGRLRWSQIAGLTGLHHTLIERTGKTPCLPDDWIIEKKPVSQPELAKKSAVLLTGIDHLVLNVAVGELEPTVRWYEGAFGFRRQQAFTIQTPQSGLYSEVLWHPASGLQFPVNEPSSTNSQIQEFLDLNRGTGIQHIALRTNQILATTKAFKQSGLSFLKTPDNYYYNLQERYSDIDFSIREWQEIFQEGILVDLEGEENFKKNEQVHPCPLLLQIFSEPIFSQPTFFFELIERRNRARGFGEGNFQALFEAIEREQLKRVN